ncbi:uncharacterized protein LOC126374293 [Pectinophora gossypiella]|uniref:uncharacterized protein LOC126374293 n=1 Tax=Pectinophora gossypiella TaxID=13191 RepID=UPI00214EB49E|nr:uncharacterized protein LOC126374293 [Pectinophora gossypiella]
MRLIFWVTALAVLSISCAKNTTAKTKPKRQLESIRTPTNLQYSLVLPHSRVTHYRSLTSGERRISNISPRAGKLPPYAVQMEPVVQYSQKDPLYDPSLDNLDDVVVNQNEIYAQPKILNIQDQASEGTYGPPYGSLPTAPLYAHEHHPHYYEAPEPIIEIIIKESNETLPAPPPQPVQKKKKEPVHVFYVKYSKDPHNKDKVVYEKPIPAITPPTNSEEEHHEDYVTVTPEPLYGPQQTTTLRAIIKPESEVYHSDSSVKITFGNEGGHHYSDRRESTSHSEDREETAPRPAIAYPQQPPNHPQLQRSAAKPQQQDVLSRQPTQQTHSAPQNYRPAPQHAQSRIQFQQPHLVNDQQLPRQGPSVAPFRGQPHIPRQNPFGPHTSQNSHNFANGPPGPTHFGNAPNLPGPVGPSPGPAFPTALPRPNNPPQFHPRPSSQPQFAPRPQFNGPPRTSFHSGPQRPFHQPQPFFDEAKYLQENYHTITTDQVDPPKEQLVPTRQHQSFNLGRPSPSSSPQFQESRPQLIPLSQQLPQQRPHQHFTDSIQNKPSFAGPTRTPFFNLKPSPPQIEDNRPPFQPLHNQPQQQFSFHQGPQPLSRPSQQTHSSFPGPIGPSPSPIPQTQFLPQPSSPSLFNFQPQPSPTPELQYNFQQNLPSQGPSERPFLQSHGPSDRPQFQQSHGPSERPQFQQSHGPSERPQFQQSHGPSERPQFQQSHGPSERPPSNFQDQSNFHHQQNVGQFVPQGGELVAAIPKYEQHITVNGPTASPSYNGFSEPTPTASHPEQQYHQQQQIPQQNLYDAEQEQVRLQLAANVQKQQEEIQRLQSQLILAQQQHQHQHQQQQKTQQQVKQLEHTIQQQSRNNYNQQVQATSPRTHYSQTKSQQHSYVSSTASPPYYQSTSRTVEIRPTTQKYVSSTANSINTTPEAKKEEKKKKPAVELPDEVPDDLRQQLLSSGILDNADISILDYDKVGETPLDSLPPDQLANFFSAGGGQQIASSENRPIIVTRNGDRVQSRIDEEEDDQELAASENVATYVAPPPTEKQAVEMKVVHFDPKTEEGQNIAKNYVKEDATQLEPVTLNDKKYNRYLPLKVSGNQFPLPDVLKGRKVTSVVVLAPVETEALNGDHNRAERATTTGLKGIKFIAGDSLHDVLKKPTKDNFEKWLDTEKKTASDLQSVVLLVTGNDNADEREIYMYDIATGNVNKLSGELSNAFVEAAENNSLSKDIEKLAIEGEGTPENFEKDDDRDADASENVPLLVDLSGLSLDQENNQVSISSGYSKTKLGRSLRRH